MEDRHRKEHPDIKNDPNNQYRRLDDTSKVLLYITLSIAAFLAIAILIVFRGAIIRGLIGLGVVAGIIFTVTKKIQKRRIRKVEEERRRRAEIERIRQASIKYREQLAMIEQGRIEPLTSKTSLLLKNSEIAWYETDIQIREKDDTAPAQLVVTSLRIFLSRTGRSQIDLGDINSVQLGGHGEISILTKSVSNDLIGYVPQPEIVKAHIDRAVNAFNSRSDNDAETRSRRLTDEVKNLVFHRDGGACTNCGSKNNIQFDHIIPFSRGGSNSVDNIQLLCQSCNLAKSNRI